MDLGVGAPGATGSEGFAINNLGHIAGWADIPAPAPVNVSSVPILWTGTAWQVLGKPPLSGDYTLSGSINNFDEIVGVSYSNNTSVMHAFLWKDGAYTVLPCLSEQYCGANSINDAGTIVGTSQSTGVVWFDGQPYDVSTLIDPNDPLREQVRGIGNGTINARGEILTGGYYTSGPNNGRFEVFVLSPNDTVAQ